MPRLYLTPSEALESPLGLGIASSIARLGPGVLDKLLFRASERCDNFCEKRLQSPGSTTLSAAANVGDTSISVTSTLTVDRLSEQAAIIDVGGFQETAEIVSGGVQVAPSPLGVIAPYPGTITLKAPLQFAHLSGAPVQYCYKEVKEAIKASQSDPYSEALQSQAAQLALAHMPAMHVGLTRLAFTNNYPIITIYTVEHCYSFDTAYNLIFDSNNPVNNGNIVVDANSGYLRFRIGSIITPEGLLRTTYTGGYQNIPDDVKTACLLFFTDMMQQIVNPYRVKSERQGKRALEWDNKYTNVDEAERILKKYKRTV